MRGVQWRIVAVIRCVYAHARTYKSRALILRVYFDSLNMNTSTQWVQPEVYGVDVIRSFLFSGTLQKRGRIRKSWKPRYFVLSRGVLTYRSSRESRPKGEVLPRPPLTLHAYSRYRCVPVVSNGRLASTELRSSHVAYTYAM